MSETIYQQLQAIELHAKGHAKFTYNSEYKGFLPNQYVNVFITHYVHPISVDGVDYRVEYVIGKDIYDKTGWLYFRDTKHVLKFLEFQKIDAQKSHIRKSTKKSNPLIDRIKGY